MLTIGLPCANRRRRVSLFAGVCFLVGLGCTRVSPPRLIAVDAAVGAGAGDAIASDISATGGNSSLADGIVRSPDAPDAAIDGELDRPARLPPGTKCQADNDCADHACGDGICCDRDCRGCFACKEILTGEPDGKCAPVTVGLNPHETCADETMLNECGNDGTCDGVGACRKVGPEHECKPASCMGGIFTSQTICDSLGACTTAIPENCSPFQCSATGCLKTCSKHAECNSDNYCEITTGTCPAKKVNGMPADSPEKCIFAVVADGVCCENACTGICEACNSKASPGSCVAVTTPRTSCAGSGGVCGGYCDGTQRTACAFPDSLIACGAPASCTSNIQTSATSCSGKGTCSQAATKSCGIFGCNGNACATSCPAGQNACPTACVNLQTDAKNCGACRHDCLPGGKCESGQCLPTVLTELTTSPAIFGLDSSYLYFAQYDPASGDALRIDKNAVQGMASPIVAGLLNTTFIGVVDSLLFWNRQDSSGTLAASCDMANCAASITFPFGADGQIVPFYTPLSRSIAVYAVDTASSILNIAWYSVAGKGVVKMAFSSGVQVNIDTAGNDFFASGDVVYWHVWPAGGLMGTRVGSLYGKSASTGTQMATKLADGLDFYMFFLDVNPQSVLLTDTTDGLLYRVPLPYGLGAQPIRSLSTTKILAATEDETAIYWFDLDSNLYRCSPTDCSNTQTTLAKGQSLNGRILLQDATALYWGAANPYRIMRLAK